MIATTFFALLMSLSAQAKEHHIYVDAAAPSPICDRFLDEALKTKCLKMQNRASADSYLSSICERQFDDGAFFDCLDLSDKYHFDPRKIQACASDDLDDQPRIQCLQQVGRPWKEPTRDREPASRKISKKAAKASSKIARKHVPKHTKKKKSAPAKGH